MKKLEKFLGNPWGQRLTILIIIFVVMLIFAQKFFRLE
jgi:hypothetical protein